jgi:hypothetical protein
LFERRLYDFTKREVGDIVTYLTCRRLSLDLGFWEIGRDVGGVRHPGNVLLVVVAGFVAVSKALTLYFIAGCFSSTFR